MDHSELVASLNSQVAKLKDQLEDQSLLKSEILRLGQENKDLEDSLKTAKADGIREAITDLIQLTDDDFLLLDGYADQLEADNGKAS